MIRDSNVNGEGNSEREIKIERDREKKWDFLGKVRSTDKMIF